MGAYYCLIEGWVTKDIQVCIALFDILIWNINCRYIDTYRYGYDKDNLENIVNDIDKGILENIDIDIAIDKDLFW